MQKLIDEENKVSKDSMDKVKNLFETYEKEEGIVEEKSSPKVLHKEIIENSSYNDMGT